MDNLGVDRRRLWARLLRSALSSQINPISVEFCFERQLALQSLICGES